MMLSRQTITICSILLLALRCILLQCAGIVTDAISTDPGYYDRLHFDNSTGIQHVGRVGNVDVIRTVDGTEIALCRLVGLFAFTQREELGGEPVAISWAPYMHLASTLMAIHHFNTGQGSVVAEVESINERCNVRLTTEFHDTQSDMYVTLKTLTDVVARKKGIGENLAAKDSVLPGAILGEYYTENSGPSATLSGVHDLVQMSFVSSGTSLNDRSQYPLFARVIPSDKSAAMVAVRYLTKHNSAGHVAVIYVNDKYGNDYNRDFHEEALLVHPRLLAQSFALPKDATDSDYEVVVESVKETGYRYVFAITFLQHYEKLMMEAVKRGIAGPKYSWLFTTSNLKEHLDGKTYEAGSPLAVATQGVGILLEQGGYPGFHAYDQFLKAWRGVTDEDVEYINSKVPPPPSDGSNNTRYFKAPGSEFFRGTNPVINAPFAYDTVIALGLAACNATRGDTYFGGREHHDAVKSAVFSGASGVVKMNNDTSSRVPTSAFYGLFNANATNDCGGIGGGDNVTFSVEESILLMPNEQETNWDVDVKSPFTFADGSRYPPSDLPHVEVQKHYIANMRYFGFILCGIAVVLSIGFATWTCLYRKIRVIRASQPPLLVMICTGTLIMASAIIPLGVDDQNTDQRGCDVACMAVPWLTSIGFVTAFSALFGKTWRANKIFNNPSGFKRIKVTEVDVIIPFTLLLTVNVTVLICWTVLSPLRYTRAADVGTDRFNRTLSTYAVCAGSTERNGGDIPYIVLLGGINGAAVVVANVQAYRARNLKTEFGESKYIAVIMASLLQSWIIGVPLLILVYDIPEANYVVRIFLIFLTTMAILLFMFIPKIVCVRKGKHDRRKKHAAVVTKMGVTSTDGGSSRDHVAKEDTGTSGLKVAVVESIINFDSVPPYGSKPRSVPDGGSSRDHVASKKEDTGYSGLKVAVVESIINFDRVPPYGSKPGSVP